MSDQKQITLEEALELITFEQDYDGEWYVSHVHGDVYGNINGNIYGDVCGFITGDVDAVHGYQPTSRRTTMTDQHPLTDDRVDLPQANSNVCGEEGVRKALNRTFKENDELMRKLADTTQDDQSIREGVDPYNLSGRDPTQSVWKNGKRPSPDYYEILNGQEDN